MMLSMPDWSSSLTSRPDLSVVGSGAQQVVDPLQLSVRQHQAVDLLVANGTRHPNTADKHRVALPLLSSLQHKKQQQAGETVLVDEHCWCMYHLHKR